MDVHNFSTRFKATLPWAENGESHPYASQFQNRNNERSDLANRKIQIGIRRAHRCAAAPGINLNLSINLMIGIEAASNLSHRLAVAVGRDDCETTSHGPQSIHSSSLNHRGEARDRSAYDSALASQWSDRWSRSIPTATP
jgi:hypothetical protein